MTDEQKLVLSVIHKEGNRGEYMTETSSEKVADHSRYHAERDQDENRD